MYGIGSKSLQKHRIRALVNYQNGTLLFYRKQIQEVYSLFKEEMETLLSIGQMNPEFQKFNTTFVNFRIKTLELVGMN
jgi:hypothetical protein